MKFRNFTPHPISLAGVGEIPSEGVARLKEIRNDMRVGFIESGVPFASIRYAELEGMPDNYAEAGDIIIVSRPIAERVHLPHIVCPDRLVRDEKGNITGCEGLAWFPEY